MEDIAITQSEERGVGLDYYHEKQVAWMLTRWKIDFFKLPKFNQTVKLLTTPRAFRGFYANREFEFYDESDELIIKANTLWVFVNIATRHPIKIPENMYNHYGITDDDMKKFSRLDVVPAAGRIDESRNFQVYFKDIDTNRHVNNTLYIEWAIETMPEEIKMSHRMNSLKVNYIKETNLGDKITSNLQLDNSGKNIHALCTILCGDTEVCRAESEWIEL
jgi:medium-chain acyl-[acyl-carrier-protein] hydrolase